MSDQIQSDFDKHWKGNFSKSVSRAKIRAAEEFFKPIIYLLKGRSVSIFDGGCGDGVHWKFIRSLQNEHIYYTGIDISATAIENLQNQNTSQSNRFLQMNLTELKEPENYYDIVFSFGVVAYTENPEKSFSELCRICMPGGMVGIWIYPESKGFYQAAFNAIRHICRHAGPFFTNRIADLIVPFMGILPTRSKMNLSNSSWKDCREIVLVNIAPKTLSFFNRNTIESWFRNNDLQIVFEDPNNPITFWGKKLEQGSPQSDVR